MTEPDPQGRGDFAVWRTLPTRWGDEDVYGHVNNVVYYSYFDTAVNGWLMDATGTDIRQLPAIGVVAEVGCRYFAEVGYPAPVDLGVVVDKIGNSSIVYRVGLFQGEGEAGERACAEGTFVHVYVDNTDPARPVTPVPEEIRSAVASLVRS